MTNQNLSLDPALLRELARRTDRTQQQMAMATGLDQSQVSRVLAGRFKRPSESVHKICKYLIDESIVSSADSVRENAELMEALAFAWDGTASHASALAVVIRSLKALSSVATPPVKPE